MDLYTKEFNQACFDVNDLILENFKLLTDHDFKEKTHLFNGRYENIYLDVNVIPELKVIIQAATQYAVNILKTKKENINLGYWLNWMQEGDVTTAHTHDDDDEVLSCVYYIRVPEKSGDLIITDNNKQTVIKAEEGTFVFFSPQILHEVSENKSQQPRLSIAFNFGLK